MKSKLFFAGVILALGTSLATAAEPINQLESEFWALASKSESVESLQTFIDNFPDSEYVDEARAMLEDLEEDARKREFERMVFATVGQVKFDQPLKFGDDYLIGRSIAQVIQGSPQYPPVEGLPESYWKEQTCSNCHKWTRENLCTQAGAYIDMEPVKYRSKQHPFGGLLKISLRNWAIGGCQ